MRRFRAFTLVELLVVIGIIVALLAILLPVVGRSWEHARTIQCQSNIRQIYHAVMLYANENGGRMPIPGMYGHLWPYFGVIVAREGAYDYSDSGGSLMRYVAPSPAVRQRVFLCPSDFEPRIAGDLIGRPEPDHPRNFSYNFNANLIGHEVSWPFGTVKPQADYSGVMVNQIRHPCHKFLIYEQNLPRDATAYAAVGDSLGPLFLLSTRHLGQCNIGFADGHVEQFRPTDILPRDASGFAVDLSYEDLLSGY